MSDPIRALLFDLGKVLMAYDVRRITDGIAERVSGLSGNEILGAPGAWQILEKAETGEMSPAELREHLNARFNLDLSETEWAEIWGLGILGSMDGMESLLRGLRGIFTLAVLSNTMPWHWDEALQRLPVLEIFDYYFLSFELGCRKPDPRIYEIALETLELKPDQVVFVDDRRENVDTAEQLGFRALLFTDTETLTHDLDILGVRPADR